MLAPISTSSRTRFFVLAKIAGVPCASIESYFDEALARERWRALAIAAVTAAPLEKYVVIWARLFAGPSDVGGKHDAIRLANGGHMRLLERSDPVMPPPAAKERVNAVHWFASPSHFHRAC